MVALVQFLCMSHIELLLLLTNGKNSPPIPPKKKTSSICDFSFLVLTLWIGHHYYICIQLRFLLFQCTYGINYKAHTWRTWGFVWCFLLPLFENTTFIGLTLTNTCMPFLHQQNPNHMTINVYWPSPFWGWGSHFTLF
jgi:hypothetical protein